MGDSEIELPKIVKVKCLPGGNPHLTPITKSVGSFSLFPRPKIAPLSIPRHNYQIWNTSLIGLISLSSAAACCAKHSTCSRVAWWRWQHYRNDQSKSSAEGNPFSVNIFHQSSSISIITVSPKEWWKFTSRLSGLHIWSCLSPRQPTLPRSHQNYSHHSSICNAASSERTQ